MKKPFLLLILVFSIFSSLSFANDASLKALTNQEENIEKPIFEEPLPPSDFQKTFIRMLISLALIIILVIVTFWAFRKMMRSKQLQANSNKSIKILERRSLSPKSVLYLLEINNKKILLSESHLEIRSHTFLEKDQTDTKKKNS